MDSLRALLASQPIPHATVHIVDEYMWYLILFLRTVPYFLSCHVTSAISGRCFHPLIQMYSMKHSFTSPLQYRGIIGWAFNLVISVKRS